MNYLCNEITDRASDERAEHGDLGDAVDVGGREGVPRLGVGDPDGLGRRVLEGAHTCDVHSKFFGGERGRQRQFSMFGGRWVNSA